MQSARISPGANEPGKDFMRIRFKWLPWAILLALIALLIGSIFKTVPTGHTGILTTFGKVEEEATLNPGLKIKFPWQSVVKIDNREQRETFSTSAFSSDIQQVDIQGSVNYRIDKLFSMNLYSTVGGDFYQTLIYPRLLEGIKSVFSKSTAEGLVKTRETLSGKIQENISGNMTEYGITILKVSVEDIDFTDAYTEAVESKQVAEQQKLKSETEQAKQTAEKKAEAERKIIEADADAEARRKSADAAAYETTVTAEAEAAANKLIAASVTGPLIDYRKWAGWNGKWPDTVVGGDALPVLNMGN